MHNRLGSYSRYRHKVGCSGGTEDLRCLHDRAGTFASLLYKAEKPSVRPHFWCHADNSVISTWTDSRLSSCDKCGLWQQQVCFYKFLRPICLTQERLKTLLSFHFASRKFEKRCNFAPALSTVSDYS